MFRYFVPELGHGQAVLLVILSGEVSFVWWVYGSVPFGIFALIVILVKSI